jgi:IPT/TIG domain
MRGVGLGIGIGIGLSARTATVALLLSAAGCAGGADQPIGLLQMAPRAANNDIPLPALVYGSSFRPTYHFDTVSGNAGVDLSGFSAFLVANAPLATTVEVPLSAVTWEAETMLQAIVPAGIAVGQYDLVVRDPRGQSSKLLQAFESLGPDRTPPVVTIVDPADDSVVGAQAQVVVVVQVNDGTGQVVSLEVDVRTNTMPVLSHNCNAAAQAGTACVFSFAALPPTSSPGVLFIDATAVDGGGNSGTAETVVEVVPAPLPTGLSPTTGSSLGGTQVTVLGHNYLGGATNVMFDGLVAAVVEQSTTSITVISPPHVAGPVGVAVEIGGSTAWVPSMFFYVDPPLVREISPSHGPMTGGTAVKVVGDNFNAATQILVGGLPLVESTFDNQNLIEGVTPPGTGQVPLGAYDPVLGSTTSAMAAFNYDADGGIPAGGLADASLSIPYPLDGGASGSDP